MDDAQDMATLFQILLISVTAVLGSMLIAMIVVYFLRTKSLNRQLRAMSAAPNFGSIDSNINRREAPTTNVYSVEGSNPVLNNGTGGMNNNRMFDNLSVTSDSSDDEEFGGIEKDPTFSKNSQVVCSTFAFFF